jgi:hypothetical protein
MPGLICSDVDGCVDGEDDGCVDGSFDFDDFDESLAIFDRGEVPVVWNTLYAKDAAPSQRQRPQNLTSASGDAIWGAHRLNYIHGQFGGIFCPPGTPAPPVPGARCTSVVISTELTSRLSLAPCCAGQPSFGRVQVQAAPRRALAPVSRGVLPGPGDLAG